MRQISRPRLLTGFSTRTVVRALTALADMHAANDDYAQSRRSRPLRGRLGPPYNDRCHAIEAMTTVSEVLHHIGATSKPVAKTALPAEWAC
jgi:hypothetical protein